MHEKTVYSLKSLTFTDNQSPRGLGSTTAQIPLQQSGDERVRSPPNEVMMEAAILRVTRDGENFRAADEFEVVNELASVLAFRWAVTKHRKIFVPQL